MRKKRSGSVGWILLVLLTATGRPPLEETPEAALRSERRRQIHQLVRQRPGLRIIDVGRALDMGAGVLYHHLDLLERVGLLVVHEEGKHKRLYLRETAPPERTGPLASETARRVGAWLARHPGRPAVDAAKALGLSLRAAQDHLKRLVDAELVRVEKSKEDARLPLYWPTAGLGAGHRRG